MSPAPGTVRRATGLSQPGPYEAALVGTPIADEKMPLEVLRTIHSFDPCMACGVHLLDVDGNEVNQVSVDAADHFSNPLVRLRGKSSEPPVSACGSAR